MDDIKFMTGYNVEPVVASATSLEDAIEKYYGSTRSESAAVTIAPTLPPGEMIEAEGIWTGYENCPFPENEIHWQFNSEGGPITGDAKQYSDCDGFMQYLDVEFKGTYDGSQNFSGGVWVKSYYTCDEDPCYPPFDYPAAWTASMAGDTITGWVDGLGGFELTVTNAP